MPARIGHCVDDRIVCAVWGGIAFVLYFFLATRLPAFDWNAIEFEIANNVWDYGRYAVGADYPTALWRPVLPVFLILFLQRLIANPLTIFCVLTAGSMSSFVCSLFFIGSRLGGRVFANVAAWLALTTPAIINAQIGSVHGISHICALGVVTPALALSIHLLLQLAAGSTRNSILAFCVGLGWGFSYLTRSEVVLPAVVIIGASVLLRSRSNRLAGAIVPAAGFLLIALPHWYWATNAASHYDLLVRKSIYQFYNSQGWSNPEPGYKGVDQEADGYVYAMKLYGPPEANSESAFVAMVRNPAATFARVQKNFWALFVLLTNQEASFSQAYLPFLFGLLPWTVYVVRDDAQGRVVLWTITAATATMSMFLLLHIDPRYVTLFIPFMLVLACMTLIRLSKLVPARHRTGLVAVLFLPLALSDLSQQEALIEQRPYVARSFGPLRQLSNQFIGLLRPSRDERRSLCVWLESQPKLFRLRSHEEMIFLFNVFARVPHAYPVDPTAAVEIYPRARIFSMPRCCITHAITVAASDVSTLPSSRTWASDTPVRIGSIAVDWIGVLDVYEFSRRGRGPATSCP